MSAFIDLLGDTPRVAVLGTFAEYPEQMLSAPDIIVETGKARRAVYYTIERLVEDGIIVVAGRQGKAKLYMLNTNDVRAKALPMMERILAMGSLESDVKRDLGIPQDEDLPEMGVTQGAIDQDEPDSCRSVQKNSTTGITKVKGWS
jgi:DNA-binding transcriptional ArsR family regulator